MKAFFDFIQNIKGWQNFSEFDEGNPDFVKFKKSSGMDKSSEQKQDNNLCLLQNKNELNTVNFHEACTTLQYRAQSLASKQKLDELLKKCLDYKKIVTSSDCDEKILRRLEEFIASIQQRLKFTDIYTPPALDSKM